jgi:hypothetical protein
MQRRTETLKLSRSDQRWWNKPLAQDAGEQLPAELVILKLILRAGEEGAWMNSRGCVSGVVGLEWIGNEKPRTIRRDLPAFVAMALDEIYREAGLSRGCPDLVIWDIQNRKFRLAEVKCPQWDRPSHEQEAFMRVATERGIPTEIVEWEFA